MQEDGYLVDFSEIKSVCRSICKMFHSHFLYPLSNPWMYHRITQQPHFPSPPLDSSQQVTDLGWKTTTPPWEGCDEIEREREIGTNEEPKENHDGINVEIWCLCDHSFFSIPIQGFKNYF